MLARATAEHVSVSPEPACWYTEADPSTVAAPAQANTDVIGGRVRIAQGGPEGPPYVPESLVGRV
jgi:hypothetical protein